ncbi:MAG: Na+/H+ antiporter subunit C [Inquilinaceae bacterium]
METIVAVLVGVLLAAAVYMMLGRNLVKFLFGLMLLSNGANLLIFASGRLTWAAPALIDDGLVVLSGPAGNSLPQALILTAIVIGFGLLAFAMVLAYRAHQELGTVDTDRMRVAEPEVDDQATGQAAGQTNDRPGGS